MLISTNNFHIYIINSSYNLLILLYILYHNDFITTLFIFLYYFNSDFVYYCKIFILSCENLGRVHEWHAHHVRQTFMNERELIILKSIAQT